MAIMTQAVERILDQIDRWPLSLRELARRAGLAARTVTRMQQRTGGWTVDALVAVERALEAYERETHGEGQRADDLP